MKRIVIETNVLVSALRSRNGASFKLISKLPSNTWQPVLSVPLYTEYQDVIARDGMIPDVDQQQLKGFLRYFCSICHHQDIFFLWRPTMRDPKDDMVLELAVASGSGFIVTHNVKDFKGSEAFGVQAIKPGEFIELKGGFK
jgi:putative PIN family toxin of toxin-antitoxin system